jgi:hypothetical protein
MGGHVLALPRRTGYAGNKPQHFFHFLLTFGHTVSPFHVTTAVCFKW